MSDCGPVTRGAGSSSLPPSSLTGAASQITDIDAAIALCFSATLNASSDLDAWLEALAAQICQNDTDIATNASGISTNASGISTNATAIASNASDISDNADDIATNAAAIATNASNISTNASGISTNASAISALDIRVDALEAPGGITDGTAEGEIPFWDASESSYARIPAADFVYDSSGGGAIQIASPSGPDAVLSVRGTTDYTNIFELQNEAGTALVLTVPEASAVIATRSRDFIIQETGTAAKGFVVKDRTSGAYKRIYVDNNAIAIESY